MTSNHNLLKDPIISTGSEALSLPGLMAALARGEVRGFSALRPHQRAAWHTFLVQLGALALIAAQTDDPPQDAEVWYDALHGLTPDFPDDEPWTLLVEDRTKPAFLQPPDPGGLTWTPVPTPDALDMLITSKNHDLKRQVMRDTHAEDWVYALVSLQTSEGYGGAGNQGIARMNGGFSSRPMLALCPGDGQALSPDPSVWWHHDVRRLVQRRKAGADEPPCTPGGPALLWCLTWTEGQQLSLPTLDPLFIEVCRRVRLSGAALQAERATSKAPRIDAKAFNGAVGDAWAPVHRSEGKSLTLGEGSFGFRRMVDLLLGGNWELPFLAKPSAYDRGDMILIAEALSRGNSKTDGLKTRIVPMPNVVVQTAFGQQSKDAAQAMLDEVAKVDKALRSGLAVMAGRGAWNDLSKEDYARANEARAALEAAVDRIFFGHLWDRVAAMTDRARDTPAEVSRFQRELVRLASAEFETALPQMPCAKAWAPRARHRARQAFWGRLKRDSIDTGPVGEEENVG